MPADKKLLFVCGCGGLCDSGHPCPMGKYVTLKEYAGEKLQDAVRRAIAQAVPVGIKDAIESLIFHGVPRAVIRVKVREFINEMKTPNNPQQGELLHTACMAYLEER